MENPELVANVIGKCFDAALYSIEWRNAAVNADSWRERYNDIDPRVLVWSNWSLVDKSMHGISIFGA
jgi:hypothetical protein